MDNEKKSTPSPLERGIELMDGHQLEDAKALFIRICHEDPENAEAWYRLGTVNGMLGDIDAAAECSRRVLELDPDHSDALVNLGNVAAFQERYSEAIDHYRRALKANPGHAGALGNLGHALSCIGQYEEAIECYQACIRLNPDLFAVYFRLGNIRMMEEEYEKAVNNYKQAVRLNPKEASLWINMGIAQSRLRNSDEAVASFHEALRLQPENVQAHTSLANMFFSLGDVEKALGHYGQVARLAPESPDPHVSSGYIYLEQGGPDQALACFQQALNIDPANVPALNGLGQSSRLQGNFEPYFDRYRRALEVMPNPLPARSGFMKIIENMSLKCYVAWLDEEIKECFLIEGISYNPLAVVTANLLKQKYGISAPIEHTDEQVSGLIERIAADELFLAVIEKTINIDSDLEAVLGKARRALLHKHCLGGRLGPDERTVASALARQGLNNEYVFAVDEKEERLVEGLGNAIDQLAFSVNACNEELECALFVYGMYERVCSLSSGGHINAMPRAEWSEKCRQFLEEALMNPVEEEELKREIPSVSGVEDETSRLVQSQYEENPYPRWITMPGTQKGDLKTYLGQMFPHLEPPSFLNGRVRMLVAGCGTGQHPIQMALKYDNVEILAVDISKSSLAYGERMARKYDVKNVRFMQGDILELSKLNDRFDIVECVGVLHHMNDPLKGWRVLTGLLVGDGLMKIGLYGEKARRRVVAAREIISNENLSPDKDSIRRFRARVMNRELGEFLYELHTRPDFHSMSGCRDLLFHFQEHRFTLGQISEAVDKLKLSFLGFVLYNPQVEKLYRSRFPEDESMTNILLWEQLEDERSDIFPGMYNFWCQKTP